MSCPVHPDAGVTVAVPPRYRQYAPNAAERVTQCPHCLRVWSGGQEAQSPQAITDQYPAGPAGAGAVLLIGLLASIAGHREQLESLVADLERDGVDVFLLLDRLAGATDIEPAVDLAARQRQLAQLL